MKGIKILADSKLQKFFVDTSKDQEKGGRNNVTLLFESTYYTDLFTNFLDLEGVDLFHESFKVL